MKPLQSADIELADCRAAFLAHPAAKWAWCIHHAVRIELLTEPAETRIAFILSDKSKCERAARFRNFRPMRIALPPALAEAYKALAEACKAWAEAYKAWAEAYKALAEACKARAEAYKARAEAYKALAEAYKVNAAELAACHTADWADHTWNGADIFPQP